MPTASQAPVHAARLRQARRAGGVGRFGVGFAAVLSVSDEPAVVLDRRRGAVQRRRTRAAVAAVPALAASWPGGRRGPGAAAAVAGRRRAARGLRHRGPAAAARRRARTPVPRCARRGAELLLALPGLAAIEIVLDGADAHAVRGAGGRTASCPTADVDDLAGGARSGELPAELLADRPVEERDRAAGR